jgi:hypothetical protein
MPKTEAELLQQFEELIADMRQLADDLLKPKDRERAKHVNQTLAYLAVTVRQDSVQAKAVIYCADAMWNLLVGDAGRGARQRNIQGLPLKHELTTKEDLISKVDAVCKKHPDKNITWVRDRVARGTDYSGAKSIARKTDWYNPTK